jgi:steroid delta-isomerase-like uncharacterized protein
MSTPKVVSAFYERIWNAGDLHAIPDLLAPDLSFRGSLGDEMRGREAFADYVRSIRAALADYRCDVLQCVTEGERAFAQMRFSGRHVGPLLGYEPTGQLVSWWGAALFRLRGERIAELWVLGDVAGLELALRAKRSAHSASSR